MLLYHGSNVAVEEPRLIEQARGLDFGIVIGAVANDTVMPTIQAYLGGFINEEAALVTLKTSKLVDQVCLKSEEALAMLRFVRSYESKRM